MSSERGQVSKSAAEIYDEFFVPALFAEWPPHVLEAAAVIPGDDVLDVACGTGALTLAAADAVGPNGSVAGLDINEGMLNVARRKSPVVAWRQGLAEALPYDDGRFDAVVSQFALMFFDDRPAALREMIRVLCPGGRLAVAVWDKLENTPGYLAMAALLDRLFGLEAAQSLYAPYSLGDKNRLQRLFAEAGIDQVGVTTLPGTARFPSIASWVFTDIKGWTLADSIDEEQYQTLLSEAEKDLHIFADQKGQVTFPAPAHIITAVK